MKDFLKQIQTLFPNSVQTASWSSLTDGEVDLKSSSNPKENLTIQVGSNYAGLLKGPVEDFNEIFEGSHKNMIDYLKKNIKR